MSRLVADVVVFTVTCLLIAHMDTNEASGLSREITSGLVAEVAVFTVICLFIVVLLSCNNVAGFCHM